MSADDSVSYLVDTLGVCVHRRDVLAQEAEGLVALLFVLDPQDLCATKRTGVGTTTSTGIRSG